MKGTFSITLLPSAETRVATTAADGKWKKDEEIVLPANVHPDAVKAVLQQQLAWVLGAYFGPDGPGRG